MNISSDNAMSPSKLNTFSTPREARKAIRNGEWLSSSRGLCPGFVQAGLIVIPREYRSDFLEYCETNQRACPLVEALEPGSYVPRRSAPDADLRTDFVSYRIETRDRSQIVANLLNVWDESLTAFLIGCSYTFEGAIEEKGIAVPGFRENVGNPLYRTSVASNSAGPFSGELIVSMRPFSKSVIAEVVECTESITLGHGAPVNIGDPAKLGIDDLMAPDWGMTPKIGSDELPLFWACSLTAQVAARNAGLPWFATHVPSYTFITDLSVR